MRWWVGLASPSTEFYIYPPLRVSLACAICDCDPHTGGPVYLLRGASVATMGSLRRFTPCGGPERALRLELAKAGGAEGI